MQATSIDWTEASWLNPPAGAQVDGADLLVTTKKDSDFWRTTSYGFVHDDGHALLTPLPQDHAVEVTFRASFTNLYEQAGLLVRVDPQTWIKAGIEFTDGLPHLGAVVTRGQSDWSLAPVPEWTDRLVTVRASRAGDALTVRARCDDGPWRMVRLAPLAPEATAWGGPMCCSPTSEALTVRFTGFRIGPADAALHDSPGH